MYFNCFVDFLTYPHVIPKCTTFCAAVILRFFDKASHHLRFIFTSTMDCMEILRSSTVTSPSNILLVFSSFKRIHLQHFRLRNQKPCKNRLNPDSRISGVHSFLFCWIHVFYYAACFMEWMKSCYNCTKPKQVSHCSNKIRGFCLKFVCFISCSFLLGKSLRKRWFLCLTSSLSWKINWYCVNHDFNILSS